MRLSRPLQLLPPRELAKTVAEPLFRYAPLNIYVDEVWMRREARGVQWQVRRVVVERKAGARVDGQACKRAAVHGVRLGLGPWNQLGQHES